MPGFVKTHDMSRPLTLGVAFLALAICCIPPALPGFSPLRAAPAPGPDGNDGASWYRSQWRASWNPPLLGLRQRHRASCRALHTILRGGAPTGAHAKGAKKKGRGALSKRMQDDEEEETRRIQAGQDSSAEPERSNSERSSAHTDQQLHTRAKDASSAPDVSSGALQSLEPELSADSSEWTEGADAAEATGVRRVPNMGLDLEVEEEEEVCVCMRARVYACMCICV